MAATYVTVAELRANLGIGTLYTDATLDEVCQAAQDQINSFLWFDSAPVVGTALVSNVATVMLANPGIFTVGETNDIRNVGILTFFAKSLECSISLNLDCACSRL